MGNPLFNTIVWSVHGVHFLSSRSFLFAILLGGVFILTTAQDLGGKVGKNRYALHRFSKVGTSTLHGIQANSSNMESFENL